MTTKQETTANGMARVELGTDGIAVITLQMTGRANKINEDFGETLQEALVWAKKQAGLTGIVIGSGHKDFCVGADLEKLYRERNRRSLAQRVQQLNVLYRSIETCGVPVVAALTGSALGGGYELALACHRRIALDDPNVKVGLPEVSLGVIPGGGGTQRLPRLVGIQAALENIAQGKVLRAARAAKAGLVDELAATPQAVLEAAKRWILANPRASKQSWDRKEKIPGPQPGSDEARNVFMAASAMLRKKTAGVYPAPERAISAVQEGLALVFDRALEVETRHFVALATSDQAKDMIRTLWFHRTAAEKHEGLPKIEDAAIRKVGILGAGMMGAGLAYTSALAGFEVVLKDIDQGALDRGIEHCRRQAAEARHLDAQTRSALLDRIRPTLAVDDLNGCDLIIEAVTENIEIKHAVTRESEPRLAVNGIWASNTSAIPITDLAKASAHPDRFIGLHFFSPVEKMQLLEIVMGADTSQESLARCLGFTKAIKKLPIVVNDGYGFYTSRVFSAYILEGVQLLAEGHDPVIIEWAARRAGMVVPPLQVFDEVTLSLAVHAFSQGRRYGKNLDFPGVALVEKMVGDLGRPGKSAGKGFYEYGPDGKRKGLWPGLRQLPTSRPEPADSDVALLGRRILTMQALEAARCIEDGIITRHRDAEVGAIFGIGFAPNTGGPLSYIDRRGVAQFVLDADDLVRRYGARYTPPQLLRDMAERQERFFEVV